MSEAGEVFVRSARGKSQLERFLEESNAIHFDVGIDSTGAAQEIVCPQSVVRSEPLSV
jgi:hypothetical protein